jgi:hypothetical protein
MENEDTINYQVLTFETYKRVKRKPYMGRSSANTVFILTDLRLFCKDCFLPKMATLANTENLV